MRSGWTDLAMEASAPQGESRRLTQEIERTVVTIRDEQTSRALMRPMGTYVTLSCPQAMTLDLDTRRALSRALAAEIRDMLPAGARTVLVTGLGNRHVTPDALGPRTAENVLVTRHMGACLPDELAKRMRSVCAAAPGVLGVTGIETAEVLRGVVEHVKPEAVIVVDALAARSSMRICSTIQIADSGITPGSGVGNHRKALTKETLGVPVIAVGVPMVVYASTIARDAMSYFSRDSGASEADEEKLAACIERVVSERLGDLIVTPREVDALVGRMAGIVAQGINLALQPGLNDVEIEQMMAQ
ncbi:MAG: GPR endopeptidase [Clostridia bacterium]|nr:GPR endopeptidase [Clostridia bacterium]MBQ2949358.1 GPR endopeptidase [Clostridia bacterium]MBQ4608037.1 GPR endopeptidase [Clostridia bacterium]MBQ6858660.1 GPR endopeptidase [Clostridia bacterium]MBQ7051806.1 GPR endopeptidase [Clostridia bacterium]